MLTVNRYEKASTIVTSNLLKDWGKLLGDAVAAGPLPDRILHHGASSRAMS
jgi:DNA replication protein DnaC